MDVETMPAGPALDRLVAERVMGWTWCGVIPRTAGQGGPCDIYAEADGRQRWFMPSTDIRCAWTVVEHLRAAGVKWEIADDYLDAGAGSWFAMTEQTKHGAACRVVGPYATTVPLAICRTALLAVEA